MTPTRPPQPPPETSQVTAVVLNYRRSGDTVACVASLKKSGGCGVSVIVVDNGSGDGSPERILAADPDVRMIRMPVNRGYAGGNNAGIRAALAGGANHIFIVNNDCTVAPDALRVMAGAARRSGAGIVSPKVYDAARPGTIQYAGYRNLHLLAQGVPVGEGERDEGQYDRETTMYAAPGCAMLLSRALCETVGLFDEQFFSYSEELDLCRRAREAGCRILYAPRARVLHVQAATLGARSAGYVYYLARGRLIYARKHLGWAAFALVFLPYFIAVKLAKPAAGFALRGRWDCIGALGRAVSWNLRNKVQRQP
ncbi:MAG: glycosyltransferase family 2 protein [Candidatus Aureabacteria bacterium]|nr:glycosyltransferase family 2 protein [Candidatus Auribacterota bacterium]